MHFRVGRWAAYPNRDRLVHGEEQVHLHPKAMAVLHHLARSARHVCSREELLDAVWRDKFVGEEVLTNSIWELRQALGDTAQQPEYIETVPTKGYRLIAPVDFIEDTETLDAVGNKRRRRVIAVASLMVAAAAAIALLVWRPAAKSTSNFGRDRSVAVLPFDSLSEDPADLYLADGLTDTLITDLAKISSLEVIARSSVMHFRDHPAQPPEIARRLRVGTLVEGSVQRSGNRLRIIAQLVDAETERHLWAQDYDVEMGDLLEVQADVARQIAAEVEAQLTPEEERRLSARSIDPQALESYLQGVYFREQRTREALERSVDLFQAAVERQADYAAAWAGLADSYNLLANYGFWPSPDARPKAREAAERALQLDESLAEAHAALATVLEEYEWDFEAAEKSFRRALELNPSYAAARHWHAIALADRGLLDDALTEIRQARRLDPLSLIINANVGWLLYFQGHLEQAAEQLERTLDLDSNFAVAHYYLGQLRAQQGRYEEALEAMRNARTSDGDSAYTVAAHAWALGRAGRTDEAGNLLAELQRRARDRYVSPIVLAWAHIGLGQVDEAFSRLDEAYEERKGWLLHLNVEPMLDPLRDDPRFLDLAERIGLPKRP